jgi:hypothetical protein
VLLQARSRYKPGCAGTGLHCTTLNRSTATNSTYGARRADACICTTKRLCENEAPHNSSRSNCLLTTHVSLPDSHLQYPDTAYQAAGKPFKL